MLQREFTEPKHARSIASTHLYECTIVIVNYNSGRWLQDCLRSVYQRMHRVNFEVIIVDNGSVDGSLAVAAENFHDLKVIKNLKNESLARAVNQGIQAAQGRYILWLNPDVIFLNEEFARWLEWMDQNPRIGLCGPRVYDDESKKSLQLSCRGFPSYPNYLFGRYSPLTKLFPNNRFSRRFLMSDWDHGSTRVVDWVSGCCILLRREMVEQIGMLDEGYPLFFEDVDICYRAHQAGWQVAYFPSMEVAHYVGSIRAQVPFRSIILRHQSLLRFYRKFYARSSWSNLLISLGIHLRMFFLLSLAWIKRALPLIFDIGLLQIGILLAYLFRSSWPFPWYERALNSYLDIWVWFTLMQLSLLYVFDLYPGCSTRSRYYDYLDILPRVVKAVSTGTLTFVFIAFFSRQFFLPRSIVLISWFFNIVLLTGWRWYALYRMEKEKQPKRVAIYGTGTLAAVVEEELRRRVSLRYEVVGFVQPRAEIIHPAVTPVIGSLANLRELTQNYKIDTVIFASEDHTEEELTQVLAHCSSANLDTRTAPELFEVVMGEVNLEHLRFPLWDPSVFPARGWYLRWKRILDFFISGCSLILASPLMLLIALAIRSNSAGPVIFRQPRTGLRGKEFTLYKFRTMTEKTTMHAEDDPEDDLKRMSSVGKFLRLTRLDEMPQLFNVLKGDMSLVGPRAEWTKRAKEMARVIPYFEQRYLVRPGMTGWSQVEYKYTTSPAEYRKKTQYDLYYIKNMSFALDVRILLKTIWVVLTAKGAR